MLGLRLKALGRSFNPLPLIVSIYIYACVSVSIQTYDNINQNQL